MIPMLRTRQAATERDAAPSAETYEAMRAAGLFRMLVPAHFGGYEMELTEFYRIVSIVARGCPSTGWWYALGGGHAVQIASYCSEGTQGKAFASPDFSAPWSFNVQNMKVEKVEGGYRLSGIWRFCSGIPHAPFMMAGTPRINEKGERENGLTFLLPKGDYTILDDWGDLIGMKGSGSNGAQVDDVFVPDDMVFEGYSVASSIGHTAGSLLHGNTFYGGIFSGFREGGLAAVACGLIDAAIDDYTATMLTKKTPVKGNWLRVVDPDFQRSLGTAMVAATTARAILMQGAQLYAEHSRAAVEQRAPFNLAKGEMMDGMYHFVERLAADTVQLLSRTGSTTSMRDGEPMQRYLRDVTALTTRADYFEFRAGELALKVLEDQGHDLSALGVDRTRGA